MLAYVKYNINVDIHNLLCIWKNTTGSQYTVGFNASEMFAFCFECWFDFITENYSPYYYSV